MELVEILYRISPVPGYDLWEKKEFGNVFDGLNRELWREGYEMSYRIMNERNAELSICPQPSRISENDRGRIMPRSARGYLLSKGMEIKKVRKIRNPCPGDLLGIALKLNRKEKTMLIENDPDERECFLIVPYEASGRRHCLKNLTPKDSYED